MNKATIVNGLSNEASRLLGAPDDLQDLPIETLEKAGELLEEAYKLMPDEPKVMTNVGHIRDELSLAKGGPFVSLDLFERSLATRVTPEALLNKARIIGIQENDHFQSLELYERAVIQQGLFRGAYGMGVCMLMCACRTDDPEMWRRGWYWFEHRKGKSAIKEEPRQWAALWRGEKLENKRLLIIMDFGLGDQVWALRWVKLAKARGATTIILCDESMKRLCEEQPYVDEVHLQGTGEGMELDYVTPVMSMGTYMDPTSRDKAVEPYLRTGPVEVVSASRPPWRVGLAWRGSVTRGYPSWRNVPFELLSQHLPVCGEIEYVSLQKDAKLPPDPDWHLPLRLDWRSIHECEDLLDTAQLIRSCDLVVTIGSLMSMLAPALGVKTWLLNTHNSAWQFGPTDAPVSWFRNPGIPVRMGQAKQGDWIPVLSGMARFLREWASR